MNHRLHIGNKTIAEGQEALSVLLADITQHKLDWNEAETRFQIIDRIIVECLGWSRNELRLEQPEAGRAYADYELGTPRAAIWEAKRESRTFDLPANPQARLVTDLPSVMALEGEAADAIKQVQAYCSTRGVEIAVASNGHQIIAFLAARTDGVAPLSGRCFVVNGYEQLRAEFPTVWQMLSPEGVAERRLSRLLNVGEDRVLPAKLSSFLLNYPRYRYPSELQGALRSVSELLLIDAVDQEGVERRFYEECYCESGALSQGFRPQVTEAALRRANNKKLIDTAERVTFDESEAGLHGEMPDNFRISTIGAYHLRRWISEFAYLDAMSYDTPILDGEVRDCVRNAIDSFAIGDRLERALTFRTYLSRAWHHSNLRPVYFDWSSAIETGVPSFERVQRAVSAAKASL